MEPQKAEENELTQELIDLTRNFWFLNQPTTAGFLFSTAPVVNSKEEAIQCLTKGARQLILTGLAKASERSWDLSNVFVKKLTIQEIVFDSDDESDEDYVPSDSDEEMEELMEYLEERLENTPTNQSCDMNLKFKFSSGLTLEGSFQQSDSINLVTGWISIKGGMPKESLVLKVNDKLLQNNDLTTLDELNVKSGSLITCFCRM